jgi:hypothetical protein
MTVSPSAAAGGATAEHEARHLVAAWSFDGLDVDSVSVGTHSHVEGVMRWAATRKALGIEDVVVALVGWLGDPDLPEGAVWPEPWPVRETAPTASAASSADSG